MRMSVGLSLLYCLALSGCGPLFIPMLPKLEPADQRKVDEMWDNLLTPVDRVDRETLLDANVAFWMYAIGVDRMHMTSVKYLRGGSAVMEVDCDRANPDVDQYTITVYDSAGRTMRRERYSRSEVEESAQVLRGMRNLGPTELGSIQVELNGGTAVEAGPTTHASTLPATQPAQRPETPEERHFRLESERRTAAATAATQPARVPARPKG